MKTQPIYSQRGFTLLETVIAIGVLAVLLTGFMVVFAPAAEGIRKSINVQQADRMASVLEQELVTPRPSETPLSKTGFDKAFEWIKKSNVDNAPNDSLLAYQYRAKLPFSKRSSDDGTSVPVSTLSGKPGEDYVVVPMVRRKSDPEFVKDLSAIEGAVYLVKCTQLVFNGGQLKAGSKGKISDPKSTDAAAPDIPNADLYPEAVIAFSADFYLMPAKSKAYFDGTSSPFSKKFKDFKNPVFTRNLAVRR